MFSKHSVAPLPKADASRIPAQIPLGCRQTDSNARLALVRSIRHGSFTSQLDPHSVRASASTSSLLHALQAKREGHCIRCHRLEDTAGGSGGGMQLPEALPNDTLVHIASFLDRRVTFQPLRIISHSIHALCLHTLNRPRCNVVRRHARRRRQMHLHVCCALHWHS